MMIMLAQNHLVLSIELSHSNFVTTLGMRHEDVEYWEYTAGTHGKSRSVDNFSETMFAASTVMNMGDGKSAFLLIAKVTTYRFNTRTRRVR